MKWNANCFQFMPGVASKIVHLTSSAHSCRCPKQNARHRIIVYNSARCYNYLDRLCKGTCRLFLSFVSYIVKYWFVSVDMSSPIFGSIHWLWRSGGKPRYCSCSSQNCNYRCTALLALVPASAGKWTEIIDTNHSIVIQYADTKQLNKITEVNR